MAGWLGLLLQSFVAVGLLLLLMQASAQIQNSACSDSCDLIFRATIQCLIPNPKRWTGFLSSISVPYYVIYNFIACTIVAVASFFYGRRVPPYGSPSPSCFHKKDSSIFGTKMGVNETLRDVNKSNAQEECHMAGAGGIDHENPERGKEAPHTKTGTAYTKTPSIHPSINQTNNNHEQRGTNRSSGEYPVCASAEIRLRCHSRWCQCD